MSFEYGLSNKNKTTLIYNGFEYTKKQSTKTTVHWICRYVKQFSCKATIITCGDTIIKFPKEHCCRYVPGEAEARKIVAAMKETSLYTGNTDAIEEWKRFLFAIWFPNSSSSFPFLIQHFFFSWCFHWVTINGRPVASSPGCQSCALPLVTALLCSHIRTMPMKLQSVTEEQTNLLKE